MSDTILIVDDEESIRRTFQEWLTGLPVSVIVAADAESALQAANSQTIDLAILDWNLGSGSDGLRLLEDLVEFQPDLVAILITGYAAQATPLEALRKGVRDYLDKNQDLSRETFLAAVRRQLALIAPAKRQRSVNMGLANFRDAVDKALPLVRSAAALNAPWPLPDAVSSLIRFAVQAIGAAEGVLILRHDDTTTAFDAAGVSLPIPDLPFHRSLAAAALAMHEPSVLQSADWKATLALYPFEVNRRSLLAIPIDTSGGLRAVLEIFDKELFTDADRKTGSMISEIGKELLRAAQAERQTHRLLAEALEAALVISREIGELPVGQLPPSEPLPKDVLDALRRGLESAPIVDAEIGLDLVAAVRELAVRHGPQAVRHCTHQVRELRTLLDQLTGE